MSTPITLELIKSWSSDQMKKEMSNPERHAEINAFLASPEAASAMAELAEEAAVPTPEPSTDETVLASAQAEADRTAAVKAVEDAAAIAKAYEDAGITVHQDESGNIVKLVQAYQSLDDAGNPVGRPTHLEARSWVELAAKQREAHTQVARAFNRLKNQKTTFRTPTEPIMIPEVPLMSDKDRIQAALDLSSDDEAVVTKADRKLRADQILKEQRNEYIRMEEYRQNVVSDEFKQKHLNDFNPCQANAKIIKDYLDANKLQWTTDNLELAFAATEPQLAAKEPVAEVTAPPAANPTAVPAVIPPVPVVAMQPEPVIAEQAVPTAPVARPGVNAGLMPGQLTATRPITIPTGLTKKDIGKMSKEEFRKRMGNPAQKAEIYKALGQKMS
jgi:hypothetical protein